MELEGPPTVIPSFSIRSESMSRAPFEPEEPEGPAGSSPTLMASLNLGGIQDYRRRGSQRTILPAQLQLCTSKEKSTLARISDSAEAILVDFSAKLPQFVLGYSYRRFNTAEAQTLLRNFASLTLASSANQSSTPMPEHIQPQAPNPALGQQPLGMLPFSYPPGAAATVPHAAAHWLHNAVRFTSVQCEASVHIA